MNKAIYEKIAVWLSPNTINAMEPIPNRVLLPDSTEKYRIYTPGKDLIVEIFSQTSPLLVKDRSNRLKEAVARLHGPSAEVIDLPLHEGVADGISYAVWVRRQPLSSNRVRRRIETILIAPRIYRWLTDITSQTMTVGNASRLIADLELLQQVAGLTKPIKIAADKAIEAFHADAIPAVYVLQHTDLWIGNILKASTKNGFTIIDWAGARTDGVPYFDLVKFSGSIAASPAKLRREIEVHSRLLGCDPQRAPTAYLLSGLGALYRELNYFPESRFLQLCKDKFYTLQTAISA